MIPFWPITFGGQESYISLVANLVSNRFIQGRGCHKFMALFAKLVSFEIWAGNIDMYVSKFWVQGRAANATSNTKLELFTHNPPTRYWSAGTLKDFNFLYSHLLQCSSLQCNALKYSTVSDTFQYFPCLGEWSLPSYELQDNNQGL